MINTDNIAKLIHYQAEFIGSVNEQTANKLYDEIVESTKDYKDYEFCTRFDATVKNPTRVMRSENFQYFIEDNKVIVSNKYFN